MRPFNIPIAAAVFAISFGSTPLLAQALSGSDLTLSGTITQNGTGANFFNGFYSSFNGSACFGNACTNSESNGLGNPPLKLKNSVADILFEDTSTISSLGTNDWRIMINDGGVSAGGRNRFSIRDETAEVIPFTVMAGAPVNSLWIDSDGEIGLGTSLPQADLHVVGKGITTSMRMQSVGSSSHTWEMQSNLFEWLLRNTTNSRTPFLVGTGAASNTLVVSDDSRVGIGTSAPQELLHIRSIASDTDAFALFEAAGSGSDSAFRLRQNGTTPSTWEFRNQQDSGRLNVGLAGGNTPFKIDNAANNNLLRLGRNGQPGEVNITGTLVVNNTTMNVPDYVFADDYALRPLAEVQAFIDTNSHLPDVPSEAEIKANGVDMTAMQMLLLKKVEELTLYTLEQEAVIAQLQDAKAASDARIARLEALMDARTPEH